MPNRMLVVKGPANSGKSTVVRAGFELLLKSILRVQKPTNVKFLYFGTREVAAVVLIGQLKVGISTRGDNKKEVERAMSFFSAEKCKVVVCATRTKGDPYKVAQAFARQKLQIQPDELVKSPENDFNLRALSDVAIAKSIHRWAVRAIKLA